MEILLLCLNSRTPSPIYLPRCQVRNLEADNRIKLGNLWGRCIYVGVISTWLPTAGARNIWTENNIFAMFVLFGEELLIKEGHFLNSCWNLTFPLNWPILLVNQPEYSITSLSFDLGHVIEDNVIKRHPTTLIRSSSSATNVLFLSLNQLPEFLDSVPFLPHFSSISPINLFRMLSWPKFILWFFLKWWCVSLSSSKDH